MELNSPNIGIKLLKSGVTNVRAKKPNTIVGIPAKISKWFNNSTCFIAHIH